MKNSIRLAKEVLDKVLPEEEPIIEDELIKACRKARNDFEEAMDDDFNSAQAYAALFELAKEINTYLSKAVRQTYALTEATNTLLELAGVLGFDLEAQEEDKTEESGKLAQVMDLVLEKDKMPARIKTGAPPT
jgi:cysteinyl-tRNA synthetase